MPVQKVFGVKQLDEGVALEMDYIPGKELVKPKMDRIERTNAFEQLVKLQCMVHRVDACGLPKQSDVLIWKIKAAPDLSKSEITKLLELLKKLDSGKTNLCHGDFHTSNVLRDGENYCIIDWVDATCGNPLADACRSYLIFKQYITRMASVYLRLFCKEAKVNQEDILVWLPVVAACRLRENLNNNEHAFIMEMVKANL